MSLTDIQPLKELFTILVFTYMTEHYENSNESQSSRKIDALTQRIGVLEDVLCTAKEVLTLEEAALFMGISRSTLYKMTHSNAIPFYRPNGKLIYFEKSELLAWMRKNRAASTEEVNGKAKEILQRMAMG